MRPTQMPLRVMTRSISSTILGNLCTNAAQLLGESVRDVGAHAADTRERRRQAGADPHLEQLVDLLALLERPEERRVRADVDAGRAEPHEVRDDARQLAGDHAQHRAPLGDLDAEQPLGAEREGDVVAGRVEIILTVGPRDDLIVLAILADLLEPAVQVADVRNAPHHRLAVELEHQPEHAVRRRVLGPEVDEHVLAFEIGLDRRRRLDHDDVARVVDGERQCAAGGRAASRPVVESATSTVRFVVAIAYSPVRSPDSRRCCMSFGRSSNASAIESSSFE